MTKKYSGLNEAAQFMKELETYRRLEGLTKTSFCEMLGIKRASYENYLESPDNLPIPAWMAGVIRNFPKKVPEMLKIIEKRHSNGHK